jgi:hypothetical protein
MGMIVRLGYPGAKQRKQTNVNLHYPGTLVYSS